MFSMRNRSIPMRIRDFLFERAGKAYCDDCVKSQLGLKWRQQVRVITATLAVTESFPRGSGICSTCKEHKQVIMYRLPYSRNDSSQDHSREIGHSA